MGDISDYLENELVDHVFGAAYTPPTSVYVGLSSGDPLDTGAGLDEPSGGSYKRASITFATAATRAITHSADVTFITPSGDWGYVSHYGIFTAMTAGAGSMMAHGSLSTPKTIVTGNTPTIAGGEIDISFDTLGEKGDTTNNISDYLANKLLDFAFRNQAFSVPTTLYVCLMTAHATDADTGSTISEPSGNNYAREGVTAWDAASGGSADNTNDIQFATPSGAWGTITAIGLCDHPSTGNLYMYDNSPTGDGNQPGNGDTVKILAGNFDFTLT